MLRMQQAGVIVTDHASLGVELLADNASPLAGDVCTALDLDWAVLNGQLAAGYARKPVNAPARTANESSSTAVTAP